MRATIKSPPFLSHSQIVTVLQWSQAEGLGEQGKLMWSHFPVCGWLGIAAAYIKRKANDATMSWDKRKKPKDARSLAVSVALEISGSIVKDEAWLRPDDAQHINMAELDAIIKGLNAVAGRGVQIRAGCRPTEVRMQQSGRIDPRAAAVAEATCSWASACLRATADLGVERIIADVHHAMGHPGIKQTLYFLTVSKHQVRQVLRSCEPCKSLDWDLKDGNEEAWSYMRDVVRLTEERKVKSERYAVSDSVWVRPPRARSAASDISEQIAEEEEEMIIHLHPQGAAYAGLCAEPAPEPTSVRPRRSMRIHRPTARLCCD
ncbi:hypothetical protein T11_5277 [Trichinella zimbabwensis]|uniref:DUF7047 domain-containing protein n=1 Tax=Trichinella zimbabwensis TaxID=268475 RepID=A0A0V1I3T6_9BILA|nr:hypothetical protein T11_5277 [Trichinella zimbabwensis]